MQAKSLTYSFPIHFPYLESKGTDKILFDKIEQRFQQAP